MWPDAKWWRLARLIAFGGLLLVRCALSAGQTTSDDFIRSLYPDRASLDAETRRLCKKAAEEHEASAVQQLAQLGLPSADGIPLFLSLTNANSPQVRNEAVKALGGYGPEAIVALDRLLKLLKSESEPIPSSAARAIAAIGPQATAAVPLLRSRLEDRSLPASIHAGASAALGSIGPEAISAVPVLETQVHRIDAVSYVLPLTDPGTSLGGREVDQRALEKRQHEVNASVEAYRALYKLSQKPPLSIEELRRGGWRRLQGLAGIPAFATVRAQRLPREESISLVRRFLASEPPMAEQVMAISTLEQLEVEDAESIRLLLRLIRSTDDAVNQSATEALLHLRPGCDDAIEALAVAVTDKSDDISLTACRALGRFGPDAGSAMPILMEEIQRVSLNSASQSRIAALLDLLSSIGSAARETGPLLTGWLAKDAPLYKQRKTLPYSTIPYTFLTLSKIGVPGEALPYIAAELEGKRKSIAFAAAARAAGSLGPQGKEFVPLLLRVFDESVKDERDAPFSFPLINRYQKANPLEPTQNTSPRLEAILALEKIGPPHASQAAPLIRDFLQQLRSRSDSRDARVLYREACERAIAAVEK